MRTRFFHLLVITLVVLAPAASFAWAPATHAEIAKEIHGRTAADPYGAAAPDMNLMMGPLMLQGFEATHYRTLAPAAASTPQLRKLVVGWNSHNEMWGGDATAHIDALTMRDQRGYVIAKAEQLCAALRANVPEAYHPLITLDNCHVIFEYGIDLVVRRMDPAIGQELSLAAAGRDDAFPALLAEQFGQFPPEVVAGAEQAWREFLWKYGVLLTLPDEQAIPILAQELNKFGQALGMIPPEVDASPLMDMALRYSVAIAADFPAELKATINSVTANMNAHGVR